MRITKIELGIKNCGIDIGKRFATVYTAFCNLHCKGCIKKSYEGTEMTIEEIVDSINILGERNVLISGGEPLCQRRELFALLKELVDFRIIIESNGTLGPQNLSPYVNWWDICLKLESSHNKKTRRERHNVIRKFLELDNVSFSFEIESTADYYETSNLIRKYAFKDIIMVSRNENLNELLLNECRKHDGWSFQIPIGRMIR